MTQEFSSHFSGKILFLSFLFLLANLGIYGLKNSASESVVESVAPLLISSAGQSTQIKSSYEAPYQMAEAKEVLESGTYIMTGDKEFAEFSVGNNSIRLDQKTEVRVIHNQFLISSAYLAETPRLQLELLSGALWIKAFDPIAVMSKKTTVTLRHGIGLVSYRNTLHRLAMVTGDGELGLLDDQGKELAQLTVPLGRQISYADAQITEAYSRLKSSKLKKELKFGSVSKEVLQEEWVVQNANDFSQNKVPTEGVIYSEFAYKMRFGYQKLLSALTFFPEASRNLAFKQINTVFGFWLGAVELEGNLQKAEELLVQLEALLAPHLNDPKVQQLLTESLFDLEHVRFGTPAYKLKKFLMATMANKEAGGVFRIYLEDLRRSLLENDVKTAEAIAALWFNDWQNVLSQRSAVEYQRQSQILQQLILSHASIITAPLLDIFDETSPIKLTYALDPEEARFEMISDRLQITASLVSSYRYLLAKEYLKKSYLNLGIEHLDPNLESTKIFLENSKLLAQRIEYAEGVLHGAAKPIDETKFFAYAKALRRDESLSADLRRFFELDREDDIQSLVQGNSPSVSEVAARFLDHRINVNYSDITPQAGSDFYFTVKNARLMDRGLDNESLTFHATYAFTSNSVTDVVAMGRGYKGAFTLPDLVIALRKGTTLYPKIPNPKNEVGVDQLLTDQEKINALEAQAIAQDVARQVAYNRLAAFGIVIPHANLDIDILDAQNLNYFGIKNALIPRPNQSGIAVSFNYYSDASQITQIRSPEGVILLESAPAKDFVQQVLQKMQELEKQLKIIGDFNIYTKQNHLSIEPQNVVYASGGLLSLTDLELTTLGLKVSGLFEPATEKFVYVEHDLKSGKDIGVKEYFKKLADAYVISFMQAHGFALTADQIQMDYPFETIKINQLAVGSTYVSFTLDVVNDKARNVQKEGGTEVMDELPLDELIEK